VTNAACKNQRGRHQAIIPGKEKSVDEACCIKNWDKNRYDFFEIIIKQEKQYRGPKNKKPQCLKGGISEKEKGRPVVINK
jgi:hypothetical protein